MPVVEPPPPRRDVPVQWLPLILLFVVAGGQWTLASVGTLTPWKGGGFGMFASTDSPGARFLAIRVRDGDGQEYNVAGTAPTARFGLDARRLRRLLARPTQSEVSRIAWEVLDWPLTPASPRTRQPPRHLVRSPFGILLGHALSPLPVLEPVMDSDASPVRIVEARVSLRRLTLDATGHEVRLREFGPTGTARAWSW